MNKNLTIASIAAIVGLASLIFIYRDAFRGIVKPSPNDTVDVTNDQQVGGGEAEEEKPGINNTDFPLNLPNGFEIATFAKDLPNARVMALDSLGNMWVSRHKSGAITLLEIENDQVKNQYDVFTGLDNPHGLAFDSEDPFVLYFAEESKISRVRVYSEGSPEKIADLPASGGHFTRTLGFGPDNRLYVSIGSSCNVCNESDSRRASIYSMNKDGSDFKVYATGLRNSVFFTWSYVDGKMWATEMGRDNLGDDVPPDEINVIEGPSAGAGQNSVPNFGWPICYGQNIHDAEFDKNVYIQNPCTDKLPAKIDLQAHSAPLGLAFVPEEGWPEQYWYDLIVAYHGSWNRAVPTGYKLVRIKLDEHGNYQGTEDFITGWLTSDNQVFGRPVDVLIQPGGEIFVSDDRIGVIYRITHKG